MSLHTRLTRSATVLLVAAVALALFALPATSLGIGSPLGTRANSAEEAAPSGLLFVENAGQWPAGARYQVWGGPGTMWLAEDAIWITLVDGPLPSPHPSGGGLPAPLSFEASGERLAESGEVHGVNLKLSFVDANPQPSLEPSAPVETNVSYLLGNDPAQWRPEVPVYSGVRYDELYPGIDLVLSGDQAGALPWSLEARSGAESSAVRLRVEGADSATLDARLLRIATAAGELALPLPAAGFSFQVEAVGRDGSLLNSAVAPGAADSRQANGSSHKAPADNPADLLYSTYLGGTGHESGNAIAVDSAGSAYVTGNVYSHDFPTTPGAFDPTFNGTGQYDAFVAKLNPAGSALSYATYLGGVYEDDGMGIAVDGTGSAYVAGHTNSRNFPTTPGAFDTSYRGGDAFMVKLNPTGSGLAYGTFLGGDNMDVALGVAVDGTGSAYVTGWTRSNNFPTTLGAFDTSHNGEGTTDVFLAKLNPAGSGLSYGTFLGGSLEEIGFAVAVDRTGSAYVAGATQSIEFPTTPGAFDTSFNGGYADAFVLKLNPVGSGLLYATLLGGNDEDWGYAVAVDAAGSAYVTSKTQSNNFPTTPGAFDTSYNGGTCEAPSYTYPCFDVFVAKLNPTGSGLIYATFLGGDSDEEGRSIAVDSAGRAYVTGYTTSINFPTTPGAFDTSCSGTYCRDAFVVRLNAAGSGLAYASFLGGTWLETGTGIALDSAGRAYVMGSTNSRDFPTTPGAFDRSHNGGDDAFVAKLAMIEAPPPTRTPTATPTRTPTSTPTATPLGPWAAWHAGDLPLLVPPIGVDAVVDYGNMATPVPLAAHVAGAALFDTGAISGTATISTTLAAANGSYALSLIPAVGATTGQTLTVHVDIGPVTLTRDGWIARPVYLPLLVRRE